jgi:hypothetical protein
MPLDAVFVSGLPQQFDSTGYLYVGDYEGQADWSYKAKSRCSLRTTPMMRAQDNAMYLTALFCHVPVHTLRLFHGSRLQFFYYCSAIQKLIAHALFAILNSSLTLMFIYWKELLFTEPINNLPLALGILQYRRDLMIPDPASVWRWKRR